MILNIPIPSETDILIKEGDTVDFQTPLYKGHIKKDVQIPLAHILKINSKKIFTVLKKFVGEEVKKGDTVAFHAGAFTRRSYISEHNGIIREVNHTEGYLIIESVTDQSRDKTAWFKGEIAKIIRSEQGSIKALELKVEDTKKIDAREISANFGGKVVYVDQAKLQTVTEEEVLGAVVVADTLQAFELTKMEALGAVGIIVAHPTREKPNLPYAILEKPDGIGTFTSSEFPYCITDKDKGTIHLYR